MSTDFDYLQTLADDFISIPRIRQAFALIERQEISGWEVWFQIEFSQFLSNHESEPEWWRESTVDYDRRMEKEKVQCRPDFLIRKKHWALDRYAALEVKQHPQAGHCIKNMVADLRKMSKVRASSVDLRSYWVLGIHRDESEDEIARLIDQHVTNQGAVVVHGLVASRKIKGTGLAYTLFG